MDEVHKPSDLKCYTPSFGHFKFYFLFVELRVDSRVITHNARGFLCLQPLLKHHYVSSPYVESIAN
jgi:hypothetical protein